MDCDFQPGDCFVGSSVASMANPLATVLGHRCLGLGRNGTTVLGPAARYSMAPYTSRAIPDGTDDATLVMMVSKCANDLVIEKLYKLASGPKDKCLQLEQTQNTRLT
jgi:hypothetical protein